MSVTPGARRAPSRYPRSMLVLYVAAALLVGISFTHSYLGERYILIRLFRRPDLPKLFGSDLFTRRTLRFAWHITSIAWLGFAGLLTAVASPAAGTARATVGAAVAATFGASAILALAGSRGRHYAWAVFLAIAVLAGVGSR